MNDVIKRVLQKAGQQSVLESPGLNRGDGSSPDGKTVFLFSGGRSLTWDCTYVETVNTFAGLNQNMLQWKLAQLQTASRSASIVNTLLLQRYISFSHAIAVKTMRVYGGSTGVILRAIGRRLVEATGQPREANYFRQNLATYSCSARQCVQYFLSR